MSDRQWGEGQPEEEAGPPRETPKRELTSRYRRSNPIENLRSYVMVQGGLQRHDRLLDIDWLNDLREAARRVSVVSEAELSKAIADLKEVLSRE